MYKKIILLLVTLLIILFAFLSRNKSFFIQRWSFNPFPYYKFELPNLSNENVSFDHKKGEAVILFFWSTWCPTCKEDLHFFSEFLNKTSTDPNVKFISISLDNSTKIVNNALKSLMFEPNFEVLVDTEGNVSKMYDVYSVPETFLIDKEGMVAKRYPGSIIHQDKLFFHDLNTLLRKK